MMGNIKVNRVLWLLTGALSLAAALVGVLNPVIYDKVISVDIMPGVFGQDLMTIVAAITILALAVLTRKEDTWKPVIILGILGYLFYAYGIYAIERVYNIFYYLYMTIFALSFWSIVYGVASIPRDVLQKVELRSKIRGVSAGFSLFVALVFNVLWIIQLLPPVQTGDKIEFLYSVYILDLCFIMPAFIVLGVMTARNKGMGLLLTPAMFILGFTLIFSLAVSESVKPLYNMTVSAGGLVPSLVLSILFLVLAFLHFQKMKISE